MRFANIGPPSILIRNLKVGFYEPIVSDSAKTRFAARTKVDEKICNEKKRELDHDWDNVIEIVDFSDAFVTGAVEMQQIPVVDFEDEDENSVIYSLQGISTKLKDALNKRLKTSPIIKAIFEAFGSIDWYKESPFSSTSQVAKLKNKINEICKNIHGPFKTKFNESIDEIVSGYNL